MANQSRDPGAAVLKITGGSGSFRFLLPAEMSGFYAHENEYQFLQVNRSGNILKDRALWNRGNDSDITLDLVLVVGSSLDVDTPGQLLDLVTKLAALAQAKSGTRAPQEAPEQVRLQIGTWFARKAIVKSGTFTFKRPFDPGTGLPYVWNVSLTLQYVYDELPNAGSFRFDR